jgi:aspartyl-tRNA(Asn)/glutamyl-tRNA(Gln) amidotransferase subunit A
VITLKEALKLSKDELAKFKEELKTNIEANADINAYLDVHNVGEGVPIAIKDNIQVENWSVTSGSNILQGYINI